jgi:hypothetical protein
VSNIGAPRQLADDLPSMGELFPAMDVPAFLTNDDVTPCEHLKTIFALRCAC